MAFPPVPNFQCQEGKTYTYLVDDADTGFVLYAIYNIPMCFIKMGQVAVDYM